MENDVFTTDPKGARRRLAARSSAQQDRSRMRMLKLLQAAEEIVLEVGLAGLTMREVARRASLPIASVYHYYPSTTSIVRALASEHLSVIGNTLREGLETLAADGDRVSVELLVAIIDHIAALMLNTPAFPAIWNGMRASPDLRTLDLEDTRLHATWLRPYIMSQQPRLGEAEAEALGIITVETVAVTLVHAMQSPPALRDRLIEFLKRTIASAYRGDLSLPAPGGFPTAG